MKRFPGYLFGLLLALGGTVVQAQSSKTDYAVAIKLKTLDNKEAKCRAELAKLRDQAIMDTDPVALEHKKFIRDSVMTAIKSEIIAIRLEREELNAKRK